MRRAHNEHIFIKAINDGYFRIDSEGRVWKIAQRRSNQYWENRFVKIPEREIKYVDSKGYINVTLTINKKLYNCKAHRIIWIYFNGNIPDNLEINHRNGIKTDNRLENLELVTCSENHKHAYKIGLNSRKGERNGRAKLRNKNIKEIKQMHLNGYSQRKIAKIFGVDKAQIQRVLNNKTWKHIT